MVWKTLQRVHPRYQRDFVASAILWDRMSIHGDFASEPVSMKTGQGGERMRQLSEGWRQVAKTITGGLAGT